MRVVAVTAYAQDLGTLLLELTIVLPEQGDLVGSTPCEVEDVPGEDYGLFPLELAQADFLAILRKQTEIRGRLSHLGCHRCISYVLITPTPCEGGEAAPIITHLRAPFYRRWTAVTVQRLHRGGGALNSPPGRYKLDFKGSRQPGDEPMANAVLVVDMLKGFLEPGHNLYCGDGCREIIPRVRRLLERERETGSRIFFICDSHDPDDLEFQMFPQHCVKGTEEAMVVSELRGYVSEHNVIPKTRYSGSFNTGLERELEALNPEKIIVWGFVRTYAFSTPPPTPATGTTPSRCPPTASPPLTRTPTDEPCSTWRRYWVPVWCRPSPRRARARRDRPVGRAHSAP